MPRSSRETAEQIEERNARFRQLNIAIVQTIYEEDSGLLHISPSEVGYQLSAEDQHGKALETPDIADIAPEIHQMLVQITERGLSMTFNSPFRLAVLESSEGEVIARSDLNRLPFTQVVQQFALKSSLL